MNLKYDLGKWKPSLKGVWNNRHDKDFDENAYSNYGIQAAVEFCPFSDNAVKDLRFHLMYSYNGNDFKGPYSGLKNLDEHVALIGILWLFKAK